MPTELDKLRLCAKYPFTKEAKEYLKTANLSEVRYETIEQAANYMKGIMTADAAFLRNYLKDVENSGENFLKTEMSFFPLSKIIAGLAEGGPKREYAKAEARKIRYFLQFENDAAVRRIGGELFTIENDKIPFYEFVKYAANEDEMKLVNFELSGGLVTVDSQATARLISQYVYRNIMESKIDKKTVPKIFIFFADELKKEKGSFRIEDEALKSFGTADVAHFPPCIRKILVDLKSGEKVGHIPRFVLSTFFANANVPIDEAVKYFSEQPNFNEKKTRYYLEHSYGSKGGTKYSVPACVKINSYGLCARDNTCLWRHPLEYYAKKKGLMKKRAR